MMAFRVFHVSLFALLYHGYLPIDKKGESFQALRKAGKRIDQGETSQDFYVGKTPLSQTFSFLEGYPEPTLARNQILHRKKSGGGGTLTSDDTKVPHEKRVGSEENCRSGLT